MDLERLLKVEPWRAGHGQPKNALSAGWDGNEQPDCPGEIEWEGNGKHWWCTACGYIGSSTVQTHRKVQFPSEFLQRSLLFFLRKRGEQGVDQEQAIAQMLFIAGVALRNAAHVPPEQLDAYVRQLIVP